MHQVLFQNSVTKSQSVIILRIWFSKYKLMTSERDGVGRETERERAVLWARTIEMEQTGYLRTMMSKAGGRELNMTMKISNPQYLVAALRLKSSF